MSKHSYKNGINKVSRAVYHANVAGAQRILDSMEEMREEKIRKREEQQSKPVTIRRFTWEDKAA